MQKKNQISPVTAISKDLFGPEYVVHVYDAKIGMEGWLVIDNTNLGPGKGGIRMTPTVSEEEVRRLARAMTWKNALAQIPFGGAKSGIVWPPSAAASEGKSGGSDALKKKFLESFARKISPLIPSKYIGGPDVNTTEREMQWIAEATGKWDAVTGKPASYCDKKGGKKRCGLPHELGSTGFGVAQSAKVAAELSGFSLKGATVAVEGFGNVGSFAMKFLEEMGARVVAIADSRGAAYRKEGLDFKIMLATKSKKGNVSEYPGATKLTREEIFGLPVDILIPATVTDVINNSNKDRIRAKIIVEGANIPMREDVEEALVKRGILIVPDFVANSGGVVSSYAEYMGYSPKKMFEIVEEKVIRATKDVIKAALKTGRNPRAVAIELAMKKVERKAGRSRS
ncbi:MAG: Glu/Leu/Phe/Val dehydrogenase [Patescibacteria group bacterium]